MKRSSVLFLVLVILFCAMPCQVFAAENNQFSTNINIVASDDKWNISSDGSGSAYETVIIEYRLKGHGIKGIQGAWIAVDLTKLLLVDYIDDGYSINDEIIAGNIATGKAPAKFDNQAFYELKEAVKEGRTTVDQWEYGMINSNLIAISTDGNTLFLCPQPAQTYKVNYDDYTTVVSFRFACLPGARLTEDSVRFATASERNSLNQSFIVAMNDGSSGFYYGDSSGKNSLPAPTVTGNVFTEAEYPETDRWEETKEPVIPPETEPYETDEPQTEPEPWNNPFVDVSDNAEYIDAIEFVYENGLFNGISATKFAPDTTMTRAMFVTVIGRLAGVDPNYFTGVSFKDVVPGEWYAPYVEWAAQEGIVQGYGNGKFGVSDEVTIEQAIVIIARYADYVGIDTSSLQSLSSFSDSGKISDWALTQMKWAVENHIYSGKNKMLWPSSPAKRYMVAEFLYAYAEAFED